MPHLAIEYSANIEAGGDLGGLCLRLHAALMATGLFELGAVRVRARPCRHFAVADMQPENGFADMILRIGQGRSAAECKATGAALMQAAELHFAGLLAQPHFALSLEIQEISSTSSWKTNAIHRRLGRP